MKIKIFSILLLLNFSFLFSGTTGTRDLPLYYTPGSSINVSLYIYPFNTYAVIVKEKLPPGWQISSSNPGYSKVEFDGESYTYTWLNFNLSKEYLTPFTINYSILIPSDSSGIYNFEGKILSIGEEIIIGGDTSISDKIEKGDINGDGDIDISDVILCLRMAIGLEEKNLEKGDINEDGDIDISDVILVLKIVIGLK